MTTRGAQPEKIQQQGVIQAWDSRGEDYRTSRYHGDDPALRALVEAAAPRGHELLLDVGTGAGHTAVAFAPHVRFVVALDITVGMLSQVPVLAGQRGVSNVLPLAADAHALPFLDGTFDIVTSRTAAHHFADVGLAVREMARVCKAGGAVLVMDHAGDDIEEAKDFYETLEKIRDPSHAHAPTREEWVRYFRDADLRVDLVQSVRGYIDDLEEWADRTNLSRAERDRIYAMIADPPPAVVRDHGAGSRDGKGFFASHRLTVLARKR